MSDRVEKAEKIRVALTLPRVYVDALDHVVGEGLFMDRQEAIRATLRLYFEIRGIPPFWVPVRPPEEDGEEAGRHE